ncbi:LuxR family transcriptional regulator [Rhizobium sp. AAP43]|uniref:helix-turn-helix transcriptional regulator n=1 Tax=Rhizobium sp. AAP43 TaxID=1523420 RepID=UPI0006B99719|nr:LuxR family transcriptional regulator [Rhizobium sp. AAP43]KPF46412.1 LuxR family transcriptional regulator [Rhizobium sp. AAP43]
MFRPTDIIRQRIHSDIDEASLPERAATAEWLEGELAALGRRFGFDHCLLTQFPQGDGPEFSANLIATTWPEALKLAYAEAEVFAVSHLVTTFRQTILPVFFAANPLFGSANAETRGQLLSLFIENGIAESFGLLLRDRHLTQYILLLSGRVTAPARDDIALLQLSAMELIEARAELLVPQLGPKEKLSARELECLRWSAAGKSSDEIAIILDISSHTVISYLKSAMRKLEAVNRMQAVARACRYNLL